MDAERFQSERSKINEISTEAGGITVSLRDSTMLYQTYKSILENSQLPIAKFQAAAALKDAAIREWGVLTEDNKISLIRFCLCYVMEHATAVDGYVQSKVSSVAAQFVKRGWIDFADSLKASIFSEVKQAVLGVHGMDAQYSGLNFLESVVFEFSSSTPTAMGLPTEVHEQCHLSFELSYLKEIYCWAQSAALSVAEKTSGLAMSVLEDKVCSAALRLMFQIMNWNFKQTADVIDPSSIRSSGIRHDIDMLKKFERCLVQPGSTWHDVLISNGHITWILNLYNALRLKYEVDVIWFDSPLAVSCRQLIVQLCSLAGSVFLSDNGEIQVKHLMQILVAVLPWIDPSDSIIGTNRFVLSESEILDGCHVLLSIATLTTPELFDHLLRSTRPYGTLQLLSILMCEVLKSNAVINDEVTWSAEAIDILLETWTVILGGMNPQKSFVLSELKHAASKVFNCFVESHLIAAARAAFVDYDMAEQFRATILKRDEMLSTFALIARVVADVAVPFLIKMFTERITLLAQNNATTDLTSTLEELYWLLLISGHVITDSGEGETVLVPEAIFIGFSDILEESLHPVVLLSWSILDFARQSLNPETRSSFFSPRLMEALIWFLARWADTYLMPLDFSKEHLAGQGDDNRQSMGSIPKHALLNFSGENNQGKLVLDIIVRISMTTLISYPGENDLLDLTCNKLLVTLVRRRNVCVHLVTLDSWRDIANAFSNERTFYTLASQLQRSLAQIVVSASSGVRDLDGSNQYVKDIMGPMVACLLNISSRNDIKAVAEQADAIYMVTCLLERLRGAARATQSATQKAIFEMSREVMGSLLFFLEIYKNESAVVYLIIKFLVDLVGGQVAFLNAKDTAVLIDFCMRLLQIYSSHNIGKISTSLSTTLQSEAQTGKYKDLRALLQLLTNICSKDLIDFSSCSEEESAVDIAEVVYVGLHIVTPLMSLDLLKYPKLCHDYFALISHLLEVYPEKVAQLNKDAFQNVIGTLDFGIRNQDIDIIDMCLRSVNALGTYHYKEKLSGKEGLGVYVIDSPGSIGIPQKNILYHFLQLLLQQLLFEDFRMELSGSVADALFPLLLCEQNLYQRFVHELLERQPDPVVRTRLSSAFHALTSSNQLAPSLDRQNRRIFRKNLHHFLANISGFMRIK